jgi:Kef-type K+ transport system membrane component KefB
MLNKKTIRTITLYILMAAVFVTAIWGLLQLGNGLQAQNAQTSTVPTAAGEAEKPALEELNLALLLVQVGVILFAARLVGYLFRKIHQPQVMGEMVAGILLGPSLLGWVAPGLYDMIFPVESLGFLNALSQIGLLLFMFLIGLELNPKMMRGQGHAAIVTSHASIIAPFTLGILAALLLYPRLSNSSVPFTNFALFLGAAMSITAFPVLARILTERKLINTHLGTVAIAVAAVDDVTGWCLLAFVVLLVRSQAAGSIWLMLIGIVFYVAVMFFVVRRFLWRLEGMYEKRGFLTQNMMALVLLIVLASSLMTETIGIHALFGAFLIGAIMPKHEPFVHALTQKLNDAAVVLLLPIFFAFTGLRTSIGLLYGGQMWLFSLLIIAVAILGKFGGSALAARFSGLSWRTSGALGILMNTRGLMELVLLNIGLDIGVISQTTFTMLVLMALVTTFMTAPILEWIYFRRVVPRKYEPVNVEVDSTARDLF